MKKSVVTIDGPAGAGKTTVSRMLADRLGYRYIDTGALYRAIALAVQEGGIDPKDDAALEKMCTALQPSIRSDREGAAAAVQRQGRDRQAAHAGDHHAGLGGFGAAGCPALFAGRAAGDGSREGGRLRRPRHGHGGLPGCRRQILSRRVRRKSALMRRFLELRPKTRTDLRGGRTRPRPTRQERQHPDRGAPETGGGCHSDRFGRPGAGGGCRRHAGLHRKMGRKLKGLGFSSGVKINHCILQQSLIGIIGYATVKRERCLKIG